MRSNRDCLWFPRRTLGTRFSDKFIFRLPSQGGMAVVGLVSAAAMLRRCGRFARMRISMLRDGVRDDLRDKYSVQFSTLRCFP